MKWKLLLQRTSRWKVAILGMGSFFIREASNGRKSNQYYESIEFYDCIDLYFRSEELNFKSIILAIHNYILIYWSTHISQSLEELIRILVKIWISKRLSSEILQEYISLVDGAYIVYWNHLFVWDIICQNQGNFYVLGFATESL